MRNLSFLRGNRARYRPVPASLTFDRLEIILISTAAVAILAAIIQR